MKIIDTVLSSSYFENKPPVLFDVGASGEINKKWSTIAPYSICIAFDADDREFDVSEKQVSGFKKLHESYIKEFGAFNTNCMVRKLPCRAELTYIQNLQAPIHGRFYYYISLHCLEGNMALHWRCATLHCNNYMTPFSYHVKTQYCNS